jgi:YVTN family beta-propeller protein
MKRAQLRQRVNYYEDVAADYSRPGPVFLITAILLVLLAGQTAAASPQDSPLAYVTVRDATPNAGAVAVIDTTNNRVVATVPVGPGPNGMAITSDAKRGYVANYGTFPAAFAQATSLSNTVSVLQLVPLERHKDAQDNPRPHVVATVTVGLGPLGVAVTPNNEEVYVTNFGQDSTLVPGAVEGNTVSVIRTSSNKVVATVQVGNLPAGVAIRPDGKRAYVTSRRSNQVWVIDTATHTVTDIIPVQIEPANLVFTPDGRRAYVTNFGSNSVSVIDTATQTVLPVPDGDAIKVGIVPIGITITPDGRRVYVVNVFSNNVSVIDTATNTVVATINVAPGPRAAAITPDGARAYVTNFLNNTIFAINTTTNTIADVIPVNGGPNWVTIPR